MEDIRKCFLIYLKSYDPDFIFESWAESSGWHRAIDVRGKDHYRFKIASREIFVFMDMRTNHTEGILISNPKAKEAVITYRMDKVDNENKYAIFSKEYKKLLAMQHLKNPLKYGKRKDYKLLIL